MTVVELLEEAGLPPLCIAVAEETDAQRVMGEMFAEAIKVTTVHTPVLPPYAVIAMLLMWAKHMGAKRHYKLVY